MLKKCAKRAAALITSLTVLYVTSVAQQQNYPVTPAASTPTVNNLPSGYNSSTNVNYVRTWDALAPITDPNAIVNADYQDASQLTKYVDGLGRPLQMVNRKVSKNAKDVVAPIVYDEYGRQVYKYLPYASAEDNGLFKTDPFVAQQSFMQSQYTDDQEQVFYRQTDYEPSPLNRVVKTMAPGNSWAGSGRGVTRDYLLNTGTEGVRIWKIANDALTYANKDVATNIPYNPASPATATYSAYQLYKLVTHDEAGHVIVVYVDKKGNTILKKVQIGSIASDFSGDNGFLCTYYVYDDLSRLRFVIPPKAVAQLAGNGWQFTNNIINELCYRYEYDSRKRVVAKKLAGADWVYMIYDVRDRLVFTQDAYLRRRGQWMATLYDALNREVMTGIMIWSATPDVLQGTVTQQTGTSVVTIPGLQSDLTLTGTQTGTFQAYNSITLDPDFTSDPEFVAEIVGTGSEESNISDVSVNRSPLPGGATFIPLTKNYYDKYDWTDKGFTASYNNSLDAGTNLHPVDLPADSYKQTDGLITGTKTKVILDPNDLTIDKWLTTVNFYDDRNRLIQENSETLKGTDITTSRYDFSGKEICSYLDHVNSTGTPASVHIKTNQEYDHAGRLLRIYKTINDNNDQKVLIASYDYDELGRLKTKNLSPNGAAGGGPLATLDYSYNIRGWLTGINKAYANGTASTGTEPWFGLELNYDKGFNINQYNGNVAGNKWRSRGDGERRAYGFSYDNANRLLGADFTQFNGTAYADNNTVKFDFVLGDGVTPSSAYDENGNIKELKQWGLKLNQSPLIDHLVYSYYNGGNKLSSISDAGDVSSNSSIPGDWGMEDFSDHNSGDDYGYDENGSLVTDRNKRLNGSVGTDLTSGGAIAYNHLRLPWQTTVANDNATATKGTITYIYDAGGEKLQKITREYNATVVYNKINYLANITTTTTYIGDFIYQSKVYDNTGLASLQYTDKLQLINHEEGRIRYIAAQGAVAAHYEYDFFIRDHLDNVRMVLTQENRLHIYPAATLEGSLSNATDAIYTENQYYNIDPLKVVDKSEATGITTYINKNGGSNATDPPVNNNPNSNVTANSNKLYKLLANTEGGQAGLGITLKVMSGDKIDIFGKSYYFENNAGSNYDIPVLDILSGLVGASSGAAAGKGVTASSLNSIPDIYNGIHGFLSNPNRGGGSVPKAYINWMFLDENFNYVTGNFDRVGSANEVKSHTITATATKNGYLYIYVSNESPVKVFFDNLQVVHTPGPLVEESHYYPFGLRMTGISSKSDLLENEYLFGDKEKQAKEFVDGGGLEMYDFGARFYDPQIGRFHQMDPLAEFMRRWSPYAYGFDNPVLYTDPTGLDPASSLSDTTRGAAYGGGVPETDPNDPSSLKTVTVTAQKNKKKESSLGWLHTILDVAGYVDQTGIFDALNAVIYLAEGDYVNAATSAIGAIPFGDIVKGLKYADEAEEVVEGVVKYADEVEEVAVKELEHAKPPCGCFLAGTLVLTDTGYVKIQDIKVGDKVWAFNDTTGKYNLKEVKRLFRYTRDTVYQIAIGGEMINATSDHPFFIAGRWKKVGELRVGDSIQTYSRKKLAIDEIRIIKKTTVVYNFEVSGYHTYFVSNKQVLVHNSGPCDLDLSKYGQAKAYKGEEGVYEHFYENEVTKDVKSYTGKSKDLGGARPKKSLRQRARMAKKEGYKYKGSRFTPLKGSGHSSLNSLEGAIMKQNGGPGPKTYNIYNAPKP